MPDNPTFIGVDYGTDSYSTEVEWEVLPDGTRRVVAIREWKHYLELEAEKPALAPARS